MSQEECNPDVVYPPSVTYREAFLLRYFGRCKLERHLYLSLHVREIRVLHDDQFPFLDDRFLVEADIVKQTSEFDVRGCA